jgi:hypothetical protein
MSLSSETAAYATPSALAGLSVHFVLLVPRGRKCLTENEAVCFGGDARPALVHKEQTDYPFESSGPLALFGGMPQ